MNEDSGGIFVIILLVICVFAIGFCYRAQDAGVCQERWRYQHTAADTLRTIRSGCDLPVHTNRPRP